MPHRPISKGRGKGGDLGSGVWGEGAVAPKPTAAWSAVPPPVLYHTKLMEKIPGAQVSGTFLALSLAWAP